MKISYKDKEYDIEVIKKRNKNIYIRVKDGKVIAKLPLPIAGLISDQDIEYVLQHCEDLNIAVKSLGCALNDAFMTMGFLSLPVIPELKITDKGLFSTKKWDFVGINAD